MPTAATYPLVYIEWEDSHSMTGSTWKGITDARESGPCIVCQSVGWLISDTKSHKTIVGSVSHGGYDRSINQVSGDMTIPTSAIRKLVRLPSKYWAREQRM